jgi:hypothetical protein
MLLSASSFGNQNNASLSAELNLPLPLSRVYDLAIPARPPANSPGRLVLSCKPDLKSQLAGTLDDAWATLYALLPVGTVVTIWHEPDSLIRAGSLNYDMWAKAFDHWVHHAAAFNNVTTMLCLTNGPWRWASEDDTRYLTPHPATLFGLDVYQDTPKQWLTPAALCDAPFEWALTHGFSELAVPEFGAVADARRGPWITDMVSYLDGWDSVEFANYWMDKGSKFDVRGDTVSRAALRGAVLRHLRG